MKARLSRRRLLSSVSAAGVGVWLSGGEGRGAESGTSPNERLNVAVVGCGGQGGENLKIVGEKDAGTNIVALCDVDERLAAAAFEKFPKARRFRDFRKMFDAVHAQIDAVVVSTPDHMHAPISLAAMRAGKHVYCEKPLCWCIAEARRMAETAKQYKVATQMGTQGMADAGSRAGVEIVRSGVLGAVREMHVWTDRAKGWWPQGVDRPAATPPVPKGLDWDLWLGVAPPRPFHPDYAPVPLAGLEGFRHRAAGRHGDPQRGDAVYRAEARASHGGRDRFRVGPQSGNVPGVVDPALRIPGPRRLAAAYAPLVRRREEALGGFVLRTEGARERGAVGRREGLVVFDRMDRRRLAAAARRHSSAATSGRRPRSRVRRAIMPSGSARAKAARRPTATSSTSRRRSRK